MFNYGAVEAADLTPAAIQVICSVCERGFGGGFLIHLDAPAGFSLTQRYPSFITGQPAKIS